MLNKTQIFMYLLSQNIERLMLIYITKYKLYKRRLTLIFVALNNNKLQHIFFVKKRNFLMN